MNLIQQLPEGPIDIVGDVHGEIRALNALLDQLGYRDDGSHPDNRRMVFVGDLVDRGPDSPAVLDLVMGLVETGHAQCVLGNHDLNLLLDEKRKDNDWWFNPAAINPEEQRPVRAEDKERYRNFLASLPLVLERAGGPTPIRVVHAAWDGPSMEELLENAGGLSTIKDLHDQYKTEVEALWTGTPDAAKWDEEHERYAKINPGLSDTGLNPGFLDAHAKKDSEFQMKNPVKLITSGFEVPVKNRIPFKAGHKWRFVEREAWWDDYPDKTPVIIGHYWRYFERARGYRPEEHGPDLFENTHPLEWLGEKQSVYCVDFGIGGRVSQKPDLKNYFSLAALRVPEWEIVLDHDSRRQRIGPPCSGLKTSSAGSTVRFE
jgi:hypothetical protein